jgi:hypothetical protein
MPRPSPDYPRDYLPKNNSDNRLAPRNEVKAELPPPPLARQPSGNEDQTQSLYDRTIERLNHKNLFNKSIESNPKPPLPQRDLISPVNGMGPPSQGRNSATKPRIGSYLLNDSFDRNERRVANDSSYNNYMNPPLDKQRVGNLIRKPKNDSMDLGVPSGGSKLRSTVLKRIQTEETEFTTEVGRRGELRGGGPGQRDYSNEIYGKRLAKKSGQDFETLKENIQEMKREPRGHSRSNSRSVGRPIDVSNDRINVHKLLDFYRDQYD